MDKPHSATPGRSSWSKDAMRWANAEGLLYVTGSNLLDPAGAAQPGGSHPPAACGENGEIRY